MDLVEIWTYSVRIWSPAQAEIYIDQLEAEINRLAEDPDLGQPTDYKPTGMRGRRCGEHHVFYLVKRAELDVFRILHVRMNVNSRFKKRKSK